MKQLNGEHRSLQSMIAVESSWKHLEALETAEKQRKPSQSNRYSVSHVDTFFNMFLLPTYSFDEFPTSNMFIRHVQQIS